MEEPEVNGQVTGGERSNGKVVEGDSSETRFAALSRHPIVASVVATVLSAAIVAGFGIGREENPMVSPEPTTTSAGDTTTTEAVPSSNSDPGSESTVEDVQASRNEGAPSLEGAIGLEVRVTDLDPVWPAAIMDQFPTSSPSQWPEDEEAFVSWISARNPVYTGLEMTLVLRGLKEIGVTIVGAEARTLDTRLDPPSAFVDLSNNDPWDDALSNVDPLSSQGVVESIDFRVAVDSAQPVFVEVDDDELGILGQAGSSEEAAVPFFDANVIVVEPREVVPLRISATVEDCICEWVLDLSVLTEDGAELLTIDNDGEPFRLAPRLHEVPTYVFFPEDPTVSFVEFREGQEPRPLS